MYTIRHGYIKPVGHADSYCRRAPVARLISSIAVILLFLACTGAGAAVLHCFGLWRDRDAIERTGLAFAVGLAGVGWLLFWVGAISLFQSGPLWGLFLILALGNVLFRMPAAGRFEREENPARVVWGIFALALLAALFDGFEALSPPLDADSMAYHFELPRRFVENGTIGFVPRAFSGAAPLMVHMSYGAALALGGETALTVWVGVSGWMASLLLFAFARRWLPTAWALALAVLFQTLPTMVYGAGSGQVEARLALFVLVAAIGLVDCGRGGRLNPAVLVGIGAGAYAAGKFTGLLFVLAAAIAILLCGRKDWFRCAAIFLAAVAITGTQWYGWNALHTGDPIFPMLFNLVDAMGWVNPEFWDAEHHAGLARYLGAKGDVIGTAHWWLTYPFVATLAPLSQFGSGRVGLGPYFLLIAPMAIYGAWRWRDRLRQSRLFPVAILVLAYYLLWMKYGGVPKVRHLLPVIPLLLICLAVLGIKAGGTTMRAPMFLATALSLLINFGAHALFSLPYMKFHLAGQDRDTFLTDHLRGYPAVMAVNALPDATHVYVWDRQLQYHIQPPTFFAAPYTQKLIDSGAGTVEPERFLAQLRAQKISHLMETVNFYPETAGTVEAAIRILAERACLSRLRTVPYPHFRSRTLRIHGASTQSINIWRLNSDCGLGNQRRGQIGKDLSVVQ